MIKYSKRLKTSFYKCPKSDVKFYREMRERHGWANIPVKSSIMCRIYGLVGREDMSKDSEVRRFRKQE